MITKKIKTENGSVEYVVEGTGETVVFLHGAGASAVANWQSSIAQFSSHKKVIAINLPSAGNTVWDKPTLSLIDLVHVVKEVVKAEGDNKITLVGYSTGAVVSLAYAGIYADDVQKVVSIAPWLANARQRFFFNFWGELAKTNKELFAQYNTLTALSVNAHNYMNDEAFEATAQVFASTGFNDDLALLIDALATIDVAPYLDKILCKVKIIAFTYDMIAPMNLAVEISEKIKGAIFCDILAGHAGPWEATEKMNIEIENFI